MNTKNLILTHFSQRYPRTFTLDDDDVKKIGGMNIAMAFDSMRIGLDDFEVINGLRQPIAAILPEEEIKIL